METKRKLIFIHIPKTAGSTFGSIINKLYPDDKRFVISGGSAVPSNYQYEAAILNFKRLDEKIVQKIDLLVGHMPVIIDEKASQFKFITFLRNPVERVISDYRYVTTTPTNPLYLLVNDISIQEYVSRNRDLQLDNLQTRLISGNLDGEITEEDLIKAKDVIAEHFIFVAFTEYFNISLVYLKDVLNWSHYPRFRKENVTKKHNHKITDEEISIIESYNKFDLKLYNDCLQTFLKNVENDKNHINSQLQIVKYSEERRIQSYLNRVINRVKSHKF